MNIGDVSKSAGLPAKTIRYYEDIGLLKPDRAGNGYRDYSMVDVHRLRILQRSRSLGFSVESAGNFSPSMATATARART